jgi:hypothetical protein
MSFGFQNREDDAMATGGYGAPQGFGAPQTNNAATLERMRAEAMVKGGASWFLWIAGLSMLNSVISSFGGGLRFIFGLGITQLVDAVAHQAGSTGVFLDLVINAFIAGVFVLFWKFAKDGAKWAFIVGMGLYLLDGLLCLQFKDILAAAFHGWALFRMFQGFSATSALEAARQSERMTAGAPIA